MKERVLKKRVFAISSNLHSYFLEEMREMRNEDVLK